MSKTTASASVDVNEDGQIVVTLQMAVDGEPVVVPTKTVISRTKSRAFAELIMRTQGGPISEDPK